MKVNQIMNKKILAISKEALVGEAASLMAEEKTSGLPVMDGDRVVGMITESDIVQMFIPNALQLLGRVPEIPELEKYFERIEELSFKRVEDLVATHGAVTIDHEADLGNAIALMVAKGIKKLPVLKEDKLVGTLTYSDIIKMMSKRYTENKRNIKM